MKISLIHPTRGRSERAYNTSQRWLSAQSGNHQIFHVLVIDHDDPELDLYRNRFKDSKATIIIISHDKEGDCVKATNYGAAYAADEIDTDIFVFLADDFEIPLPQWDEKIAEKGIGAKWILKINDGCQDPNNTVITMPIMNRGLYNDLGYLWNPLYKSMWVDVDLYFTCLPFIIQAHNLKFQHVHPSWVGARGMQMDETYKRSTANWNQGAEVFNKRVQEMGWINAPIAPKV